MEGFLEKKGGSHSGLGLLPVGRRNWKRRWFVLEGAVLTYYEDFDPATNAPVGAAKGCVDLRGCQAKLCPHKPRKGTPRVHTFSIEKPKGERLLMEATGPMAEKLKFAWLRALEDAIAKSMSKEGRRASLRAAQDVDAPEHYERLGLEKRDDLTDKDIRKAYRRVAVAQHPDRGGDPESFIALHEAYEVIINARAARREALRYGECVFEGRIKKEPKGGFGLTVCERKEGGVAIKRVVFWSCATTCVERPEGIERELPSSELSFRAGDRIVGVDGDDTRRWSVTRLIQRLDNFRVPAEASILLRVARPVLLDVHAEPRRPSRAAPSPRPARDDGAEPSRDDGAAPRPSREDGAAPRPSRDDGAAPRPSREDGAEPSSDDGAAVPPPPPPPPDDDGPAAASGPPERPARRRSSAAVSVASEPDAELRRENDELRSEVLRLRESLALADARRATAERELRDAREDAAAAPPRPPLAARNAPPPAASADIARRLERFKKRLGAMNAKPVPDRQERVRRESFVERGDLQKRAAAIDLRLRFRPSDEDLRRANICHFHRQWHL